MASDEVLPPEDDPNEWLLASPEEVGLDAARFDSAMALLPPEAAHGMHSMLIVRHGKLVVEQYWNGQGSGTLHDLRSATKSITSLLVGIAIDKRAIADVSERIMLRLQAVYPNLANPDPRREQITVEDLLRMETGLACNDWDFASPGNEEYMYLNRDWVRFFLDLPPLEGNASSRYCTAGVVTLGRVVKEATQQPTEPFADESLFAPLGIRRYRWSTFDNDEQVDTGGHLYLRARDMAKIGQLVLQQGQWEEQQVVSAAWIEQSTQPHTLLDGRFPYGYLWWRYEVPVDGDPVPFIAANGNGGQYIFIVPRYDVVVVFTGGNYNRPEAQRPFEMLQEAILPAFSRLD